MRLYVPFHLQTKYAGCSLQRIFTHESSWYPYTIPKETAYLRCLCTTLNALNTNENEFLILCSRYMAHCLSTMFLSNIVYQVIRSPHIILSGDCGYTGKHLKGQYFLHQRKKPHKKDHILKPTSESFIRCRFFIFLAKFKIQTGNLRIGERNVQ